MGKYMKWFETKNMVKEPRVGEYFRVGKWLGWCRIRIFGYALMVDFRGLVGPKL